ncbi:hypothetical protein KSS87_008820 [Heliosperma pusillum]|nr:hypothetical protein KSS87_008820 [Heliosperma pusillum]
MASISAVIFFLLIIVASEISVFAKEGADELQEVPRTMLFNGRKLVVLPVAAVTTRKQEKPRQFPPSPRRNDSPSCPDPPPSCL